LLTCLLYAVCCSSFLSCLFPHRYLHSFPTRRSSDLISTVARFLRFSGRRCAMPSLRPSQNCVTGQSRHCGDFGEQRVAPSSIIADRKSTRLNSSHGSISYAVFCLKNKKVKNKTTVNR